MVSILAIIDDQALNKSVLDVMLKHCRETEIELLILNNSGNSIEEFLKQKINRPGADNFKNCGEMDEITFNRAQGLNKLITEAKGEYVCIFDCRAIVNNNWLFDLLYYHSLVKDAGIAAIPSFKDKKIYTPLIDNNDEMISVWKTPDNSVDGIFLMKKEVAGLLFDEANEDDFKHEFSLQVSKNLKLENFYIPGQFKVNM